MLIDFKDEDFDNKIKNEDVSVIQFSAAWCGPYIKPVMDKLAENTKISWFIMLILKMVVSTQEVQRVLEESAVIVYKKE